jgi:hypothetical protein
MFSKEWCALIRNFLPGGSVAIEINDDVGKYFQIRKCLIQGDPLSHMLFNIIVAIFSYYD